MCEFVSVQNSPCPLMSGFVYVCIQIVSVYRWVGECLLVSCIKLSFYPNDCNWLLYLCVCECIYICEFVSVCKCEFMSVQMCDFMSTRLCGFGSVTLAVSIYELVSAYVCRTRSNPFLPVAVFEFSTCQWVPYVWVRERICFWVCECICTGGIARNGPSVPKPALVAVLLYTSVFVSVDI